MAKHEDRTHRQAKPDPTDRLLIDAASTAAGRLSSSIRTTRSVYQAGVSPQPRRQSHERRRCWPKMTIDLPDGECDAADRRAADLRRRSASRSSIRRSPPTVEGSVELRAGGTAARPRSSAAPASRGASRPACEALLEELDGPELDDEEYQRSAGGAVEDDEEVPLIGDDPTEPPAATGAGPQPGQGHRQAHRPQAATRELNIEDRGWLEQTPQVLPVITDLLVAEASATAQARRKAGRRLSATCCRCSLNLSATGRIAAGTGRTRMLNDYQQRLIALGEARHASRRRTGS